MKKAMSGLLVIILAFAMAGCAKKETVKVSICTPYMSSVTTKQMVDLMESQMNAKGYEVAIYDSANDTAKFAADIETSAVSGFKAIIIVSADPSLCKTQIQEAYAAKVKVFGCDSGYIDEMQMNATSDNRQMGEAISKYLFEKMGKKGTFVHLTHRPHPGVVQRTLAMEEILMSHPDIKLLSEHHVDVPNQINNSKVIVENLLTAYPSTDSITAILCAWDEPAIGATQALQEASRKEVLVVGIDGNEQAVKLINENTNFIATLKQDFEGMAKSVTEELVNVMEGRESEKGNKYVPALLIERK